MAYGFGGGSVECDEFIRKDEVTVYRNLDCYKKREDAEEDARGAASSSPWVEAQMTVLAEPCDPSCPVHKVTLTVQRPKELGCEKVEEPQTDPPKRCWKCSAEVVWSLRVECEEDGDFDSDAVLDGEFKGQTLQDDGTESKPTIHRMRCSDDPLRVRGSVYTTTSARTRKEARKKARGEARVGACMNAEAAARTVHCSRSCPAMKVTMFLRTDDGPCRQATVVMEDGDTDDGYECSATCTWTISVSCQEAGKRPRARPK
jgi:hypothetical protein